MRIHGRYIRYAVARAFPAILGCLMVLSCWGCEHPPERLVPEPTDHFEKVPATELPDFADDLDEVSLRTAIERSLTYYGRIPGDRDQPLGTLRINSERLKESLFEFLRLLDGGDLNPGSIARQFDVYRVQPGKSDRPPLVTGYFEPVLEGRLKHDSQFRYPLYSLPTDLVTVDLSLFNSSKYAGESLVGRVQVGKLLPYYTRREIDGMERLKDSARALVWIKDPVDGFVLQVQGSGMIRLPDGQSRQLGYAGANGRPYKSIGKVLLERGVMSPQEISLQSIRSYLAAHPEQRDEILWQNESYVFFRWVKEGPVGSLGVPLTGGRSIATDPKYHPRGALAFLETQKPLLDERGEVVGWVPLHRWVLNQDTGGAIKGVGRTDLFCGSGESAEAIAGRMKHSGTLYFLVKKDSG